MTAIRTMTPHQLAEHMGRDVTAAEVSAMLNLLLAAGFERTEDVPEARWATMTEEAVIRAEWIDRVDVADAIMTTKPGKVTHLDPGEYVTRTGWLIYRSAVEHAVPGWIATRPSNTAAHVFKTLSAARTALA